VLLGTDRGPAGGLTALRPNLLAAAVVCRLERTAPASAA
jgi:hypothetical protein